MSVLSLDTNVMIDIINGRRPQVRAHYDAARGAGDQLVASALAAHELLYGAFVSARPDVQTAAAEELLDELDIVDWTFADALGAARVRAVQRRSGSPIGFADVLIAGQAVARGWKVVSHNLKHFDRVEGLAVLDWTQAATSMQDSPNA